MQAGRTQATDAERLLIWYARSRVVLLMFRNRARHGDCGLASAASPTSAGAPRRIIARARELGPRDRAAAATTLVSALDARTRRRCAILDAQGSVVAAARPWQLLVVQRCDVLHGRGRAANFALGARDPPARPDERLPIRAAHAHVRTVQPGAGRSLFAIGDLGLPGVGAADVCVVLRAAAQAVLLGHPRPCQRRARSRRRPLSSSSRSRLLSRRGPARRGRRPAVLQRRRPATRCAR